MTRTHTFLAIALVLGHGVAFAETVRDHPDEHLAANVAEMVALINEGDSGKLERFVSDRYGAGMLRGTSVEGRPADCIKLALCAIWPDRFGAEARPDLTISGKLAQFGSRMIQDVSKTMFQQFTENFAERLRAETEGREAAPAQADAVSVTELAGTVVKGAIGRIFGKDKD